MGLMNKMRDQMRYMLIILVIAFMGTIVFDWGMNYLGGDGGGLCLLKGQRVLFVDLDADLASQLDTTVLALAQVPELDEVFLPPVLRQALDAKRTTDAPPDGAP